MNREHAKELVKKYNAGGLSPSEEAQLEQYIEQGWIHIAELKDLHELDERLDLFFSEERSRQMRLSFQQLLDKEKGEARPGLGSKIELFFRGLWSPSPRLVIAYTVLLLVVGAGAGYLWRNMEGHEAQPDIAALSDELREMREMMMLTLLEKESTSDRLKAVNLTREMSDASGKVVEALFRTLNNDPNVNVRLSAVDALSQYAGNPQVRRGLIESIGRQESPMMQMALAEVMVALQEKGAIEELRNLLEREETAPEAREKIRESIEILM
jgi:hypothetical protein